MSRIPRYALQGLRSSSLWIVRLIQHLLRVIYRNLPTVVHRAFRIKMSFLRRLTKSSLQIFRYLKFYIVPLITILIKIIKYLISVIERRLQLPTNDDNKLAAIANAEPRGLQNLGNTCYFNSVMQSLCHTHNLEELLRRNKTSGDLTESFRDFYTNMLSGKSGPFSPSALRKIFARESSRFDNREQHDSHECLRHFLDNVRKEEKRQLENTGSGNSTNMLTVVDTVFGGHLMTVYVCMTCQSPYHLCEPCLDVSLPICFDRPTEESLKQGLSKTWKDVQTTEEDNGSEKSKDETSDDSKLEQFDEDETRKTNEDGGKNSDVENEDTEDADEEEGEEEEEEAEGKVETKRKKNDQADNKVIALEGHEDGNDEKIAVENELQHDNEEIMSDEEEEKHVEEEKHETEKLVDDEDIRHEEETKNRGSKTRKEGFRNLGTAKEQSSPTTMIKNRNDQEQHVESKPRSHQKLKPKVNTRKMKTSDEPEVRVDVKSQEPSNVARITGRSMNTLEDEEPSKEIDPYRNTIGLVMQPLSSNSNTQLRGIDSKDKSVEDCLMYFTRKEHLDKDYLCKDCNSKHLANGGTKDVLMTSATKQTLIFNPPAILTLHLKRFELKQGGSVKRRDMITYADHLDIAPFCSSMCLRNDPPSSNIWYSLYAVVVHSGSLDSGHYIAYIKVQRKEQLGVRRFLQMEHFDRDITKEELIEMTNNKQRNSRAGSVRDPAVWYCANDSTITKVSLEEVLNQEAYLLFYERL